ncbi:MAG: hypothetical protein IT382_06975 [Deltaproteobacteria bacterium]|nr:hypothetical protein [Deltaproteobacteria bacterium]
MASRKTAAWPPWPARSAAIDADRNICASAGERGGGSASGVASLEVASANAGAVLVEEVAHAPESSIAAVTAKSEARVMEQVCNGLRLGRPGVSGWRA